MSIVPFQNPASTPACINCLNLFRQLLQQMYRYMKQGASRPKVDEAYADALKSSSPLSFMYKEFTELFRLARNYAFTSMPRHRMLILPPPRASVTTSPRPNMFNPMEPTDIAVSWPKSSTASFASRPRTS